MTEPSDERSGPAAQLQPLVRSPSVDSLFRSRPFAIMDYFIREKEAETRKRLCNPELPPSGLLIEQNVDSIFYSLVRRWDDVKNEIAKYLESRLPDSEGGD